MIPTIPCVSTTCSLCFWYVANLFLYCFLPLKVLRFKLIKKCNHKLKIPQRTKEGFERNKIEGGGCTPTLKIGGGGCTPSIF